MSSDGHGSSYFSGERPGAAAAAGASEPSSGGAGAADERTVTLMEPVYPSGSLSRAASSAMAGSSPGSGLGLGGSPPPEPKPHDDAAACPLRHVDSLGASPWGLGILQGCVALAWGCCTLRELQAREKLLGARLDGTIVGAFIATCAWCHLRPA